MNLSTLHYFLLFFSYSSCNQYNNNDISDSKKIDQLEEKFDKFINKNWNACSLGEQSSKKQCFTQRNEESHYTLTLSYCSKDNTTLPSSQIDLQAKLKSTGISEFSASEKLKSENETGNKEHKIEAGCSCSDLQKLVQNSGITTNNKKELRNIALHKPIQSSASSPDNRCDANLVDGDLSTQYLSKGVTAAGPKAWVMIDLGTDTTIEYIKLVGLVGHLHRIGDLVIYLSKTFNPSGTFRNYPEIMHVLGNSKFATPLYKINKSVSGRYFIIERQKLSDYLHLFEVQIFAFV